MIEIPLRCVIRRANDLGLIVAYQNCETAQYEYGNIAIVDLQ